MNEVKTFRAASMHEALAIVRRELGMDAVILHTRQITQRRLIPFLKPREEVEITAGVSLDSRPVERSSVAVAKAPVPRPKAAVVASSVPAAPVPTEIVTGLSKAAQIAAELERRQADRAKLNDSLKSLEQMAGQHAPSKSENKLAEPSRMPQLSAARTSQPASVPSTASRNSRLPQPADVGLSLASGPDIIASEPPNQAAHLAAAMEATLAAHPVNAPSNSVNELTTKLDALQKMVESLTKSTQFRQHDEVPSELFDVYTRLIDVDIEDELARDLIFRLRSHCSPEQLHDATATNAILSGMVQGELRCAAPIQVTNSRRKVVALVGPTGVGKTTTIAKLAANFRLRDGIRMGLVTVDTYRIAAVEQLRTYAEIIDLPMKVVTSPQEMRRALDELTGLDLVLVDTAGRSPRDELKIQELKSLLGEAHVDEVHLVMSLTASVRGIKMIADQFRPVNPTAMVLTKLDEAAGMGSLLSVSRQVQLPVSYVTTGQDVPDDIEPANASRLARLVLGQDRLTN